MKKILPLCIAASLLAGCANNIENIDTAAAANQAQVDSLSNLNWTPLKLPSDVTFELNEDSQTLAYSDSAGPVAAFLVPANRGAITVNLKSYATTTLYAPSIKVLDENNKELEHYSYADFVYKPARMLEGDLVEGTFSFIPTYNTEEVKVLVYTNPQDLQTSTELLHPAKAYARARSTVEPDIPNPHAQHSPYGKFSMRISSPQIDNASVAFTKPRVDQAPAMEETQGYYLNSIENAVNNGDINKAMQLLEEAERLGIKEARPTFINAVENK
ncbi:hypothetical protein BIZ37_07355 [Photobacterium sp. BZF1]|uniref:MalM family protein n=1 Tax=Photobacterium TaxID=657 RepID=UPI00165370D4|nr:MULTISPECIES: MalM family protein [Photobacterium]MBC7002371.1 hypothetical protein [Photobacterium sp. BZF1]MBY5944349.1 hypothetical protein [Photobacterium rosenbergii]